MENPIEFLEKSAQGQLVALLSLGLVVSFGAGVALDDGAVQEETAAQDSSQWKGVYTVQVERDGEVVYKEKEENILTNQGQNWIRSQISATDDIGAADDGDEAQYISVGNETAPAAGDTVLPGEIENFDLSRTQGDTTSFGDGEFQVQNTFTANLGTDQQLVVNTTGLNYQNSGDTLVSGGEFPDANLLDGDQLTVTHNVTISDGGN